LPNFPVQFPSKCQENNSNETQDDKRHEKFPASRQKFNLDSTSKEKEKKARSERKTNFNAILIGMKDRACF
jgi:hypothetical protein